MGRIIKWLLIVDAAMVLLCLALGKPMWLLSTQIGFWSSTLVLGASMRSYKNMVYNRLADGTVVLDDDRDMLDKMEDPYDLYGEDEQSVSIESADDIRHAIKEEKEHMKRNRRSAFETLKDSRASMSLYRLGSYLLLFLGFFYLSSNQLLHIPSYLIALSLPIVIIVTLLLSSDEGTHEESY